MRSDRGTRALRLLFLSLMMGAAAVRVPAGTLLERTVAFVNKRPVLLSDVELARKLLKLGEAEAIERSIDETLMFEEASRLLNDAPAADAVEAAVAVLREKAGSGFSQAALKRKALVQLAVANYIDLRLRPLVRVEDAEVRRVFNEMVATQPETPAFSAIGPGLRQSLEADALDERIEEWVAGLRLRADIRRPAPPEPPPSEPGAD
jgi:hypothetical protein